MSDVSEMREMYDLVLKIQRDRRRRKARKILGIVLEGLISPGTAGMRWAENERKGWR